MRSMFHSVVGFTAGLAMLLTASNISAQTNASVFSKMLLDGSRLFVTETNTFSDPVRIKEEEDLSRRTRERGDGTTLVKASNSWRYDFWLQPKNKTPQRVWSKPHVHREGRLPESFQMLDIAWSEPWLAVTHFEGIELIARAVNTTSTNVWKFPRAQAVPVVRSAPEAWVSSAYLIGSPADTNLELAVVLTNLVKKTASTNFYRGRDGAWTLKPKP